MSMNGKELVREKHLGNDSFWDNLDHSDLNFSYFKINLYSLLSYLHA